MLTIRQSQLRAFSDRAEDRFLRAMAKHLRTHFAEQVSVWPVDNLHEILRELVRRAGTYGLKSERDICRFLNVAAWYGSDFDRDPQHAWMVDRLADPRISGAGDRLGQLLDECVRREILHTRLRHLEEEFGVKSA